MASQPGGGKADSHWKGVTGLVTRPRGELAQRHLSGTIPKRASVLSLTHPSLAPRNRRNFNRAGKRSTTKPLDLHPTYVSKILHKSEAMPTGLFRGLSSLSKNRVVFLPAQLQQVFPVDLAQPASSHPPRHHHPRRWTR